MKNLLVITMGMGMGMLLMLGGCQKEKPKAPTQDQTVSQEPRTTTTVLTVQKDFARKSQGDIQQVPDNEVFEKHKGLQKGFSGNQFSIKSQGALAKDTVKKTTVITNAQGLVVNQYDLEGIKVNTEYRTLKQDKQGAPSRIKQIVTLENPTDQARLVTWTTQTRIRSDRIRWQGQAMKLDKIPHEFRYYENAPAQGARQHDTKKDAKASRIEFQAQAKQGSFDWSDALHLKPVVRAFANDKGSFLEFTVEDVNVPARGKSVIDPLYEIF